MPAVNKDQLYCSVDLEFTGFDPSRDQILEIGFAFFKVSDEGLVVTEQWDQVFKPSIEVHPKILGLTGISQEELDAAPEFSEHREFLQEKLGDAIIVGHNPVMDIKFLESYGLKLSGKVIDTLELVQFILPTHHSYNLENLVHFFGIKHTGDHQAHRALADALATTVVLENLMHLYQQFPKNLKDELREVTRRGDFTWRELFENEFPPKKIQSNDSLISTGVSANASSNAKANLQPLELNEGLITIDSSGIEHEMRVALGLQTATQEVVLAVQDSASVMKLWQDNLVHGVFKSDDTFSKNAFNAFLNKAETTEELRFCLKVIVWLHVNWQTDVVLDLNISFFGGQFKSSIVGGKPKIPKGKLLCVDYVTLQTLEVSNYKLVICDIQNFEKFMSSGFGTRLSWGALMYSLKLIYNPENEFGNLELRDDVTAAMASTDLFFSLVYMLLHSALPSNEYVTLEELSGNHEHIYNRLKNAADNLKEKLAAVEKKSKSSDLSRATKFLESFFEISTNRVKWVTIDERNLSFHDQPIDISENIQGVLKNYSDVRITETVTGPELLSYYVDRLGLHTDVSEFAKNLIPSKVSVVTSPDSLSEKELFKLSTSLALPMVIVLPSPVSIKNFYNDHYQEIKKNAALFAQGYSGGGNKMFRNFSIKENSILLVTAEFMAKQNYKISAQTVLIAELPSIEASHPYTAALLSHWKKQYPDLLSLFSFAKVTAALKKLKLNKSVSIFLYKSGTKNIFVDKSR